MEKFKAGDRVRRVGCTFLDAVPGTLADVIEVTEAGVKVRMDSGEQPTWMEKFTELVHREVPQVLKAPLPHDSAERKTYPLMTGLVDYFPSALAAVAHHSYEGNEKHNPGQDLHWARGKSMDHLDAAMRHLMERDLPGAAWRVLAALQMELEGQGHPVAPAAR